MSGWDVVSWINGFVGASLLFMFNTTPISEINTTPGVIMLFLYAASAFVIIRRLVSDDE